jgi:hypothetical protein
VRLELALAIGATREGAVHANVRKAIAAGVTVQEIDQIIALTAGTLGLSETVAIFAWVRDTLAESKK